MLENKKAGKYRDKKKKTESVCVCDREIREEEGEGTETSLW